MTLIDSETQVCIGRLLGGEAIRPLIARLDRRLGKSSDLSSSLTVSDADEETIDTVTGLLGKPPPKSERLTVRLSDLDAAVAAAIGVSLITAVSALLGRPSGHRETLGTRKLAAISAAMVGPLLGHARDHPVAFRVLSHGC